MYVVALGQEVCLDVTSSQSRQSSMQSSTCVVASSMSCPECILKEKAACNSLLGVERRAQLKQCTRHSDMLHANELSAVQNSGVDVLHMAACLRTTRQRPCLVQARSCHPCRLQSGGTPSQLSTPLVCKANHSYRATQTLHGSLEQLPRRVLDKRTADHNTSQLDLESYTQRGSRLVEGCMRVMRFL